MIVVTIILFIIIIFAIYLTAVIKSPVSFSQGELIVIEVIDGDTIKTSDGQTIRLLCINTPEQGQEGYLEAKEFLDNLTLGKEVRLATGKTFNQTDEYNRLLAYVYINNRGEEVSVNKLIIQEGYSEMYEYGDVEGECEWMMKSSGTRLKRD